MERRLKQLVTLTRALGKPQRDYVILSEGNTSVRADESTFWVKASGSRMADVDDESFVQVRTKDVLGLLDGPTLPESQVRDRLAAAKVHPDALASPSIETPLHALCLTLGHAIFVGHTHPTPVNAILCATGAEAAFSGSIFPAESLVCGEPLFVPYAPPGQALGRTVQEALRTATEQRGEPPRAILLQNHGLVALGSTPQEVLDITEMMVKAARILMGTYALGGPRFVNYHP
jgi:rhamnose utilization protein RhaD (predicted bifunctional aldolase and dehydrogenase)